MESLCRKFWWPPYALLRDAGIAAPDASLLTRHFLREFSRGNEFGRPKQPFLRLRMGLFEALNGFLADPAARAAAYESTLDPGVPGPVPPDAEDWMRTVAAGISVPGDIFRRRWALVVMDLALAALRREFAANGQLDEFGTLKPGLARRQAVKDGGNRTDTVLVSFRERFQKLVLEEVSQTVSTPTELDAEFGELFD
jgi:hypothetical protein